MIAIALILALCVGGGVSLAAENSVPGDVLYVVKTEVNENVRAAVAVSAEAEANWQAKAAERRLKEAQELSAQGELTADVAAELGAQFSEHAEAALAGAQTLAVEGNLDASSEITAEIEAVVSMYADLFAYNAGSVAASGKAFVLPHVLEKSGRVVVTADADLDGGTDVRVVDGGTIKSETSVRAEGGSSAEASSKTKMEGSVKVDLDL
jgi:hypothetical protein